MNNQLNALNHLDATAPQPTHGSVPPQQYAPAQTGPPQNYNQQGPPPTQQHYDPHAQPVGFFYIVTRYLYFSK
jgi:hypothetical protein